jgi:hypothetical protein
MSVESQNCENRAVARERLSKKSLVRQWLSGSHMKAVKDTHATIEELLKAVFPAWSVPMLYKEVQLPLQERSSRQKGCPTKTRP